MEQAACPRRTRRGAVLFLFQWLVGGLVLMLLGIAVSWALLAPADVRGHATLVSASLVSQFALGAALIVFATIHLGPRLP